MKILIMEKELNFYVKFVKRKANLRIEHIVVNNVNMTFMKDALI